MGKNELPPAVAPAHTPTARELGGTSRHEADVTTTTETVSRPQTDGHPTQPLRVALLG
jgi:hypothetical protein